MNALLREVTEADLPIFYHQQADPEARRMVGTPGRDESAFFAHWRKTTADPAVTRRTIVSNNHVAGYVCSFNRLEKREIGYWLGREFWGKGIATQALTQFLTLEKSRPLCARVAKRNPASVRVIQKCGFTLDCEDRYKNEAGEEIEEFVYTLAG